jgi:hypothetical protein
MPIYDLNTDNFNKQLTPPTKRKPDVYAWGKVLLSPLQWLRDLFFDSYAAGNTAQKSYNFAMFKIYVGNDLVYYPATKIIYKAKFVTIANLPTNATYFDVKPFIAGERLIFVDKAVYECILDNPTGISPLDSTYWIKIQDLFVGLRDRINGNSQVLIYEYLLNKYFFTAYNYPSINEIYISRLPGSNSSFVFGATESESSVVYLTDGEQKEFINDTILIAGAHFAINIPVIVYDALIPSEPTGTTTNKDNIVRSYADMFVCAGITYTINPY